MTRSLAFALCFAAVACGVPGGDAADREEPGTYDRWSDDPGASPAAGDAGAPGAGAPGAGAPDAGRPDAGRPDAGTAGTADAGHGDAGTVFPPPGTLCQYQFFRSYFDPANGTAFAALRAASFSRIVERVRALQACGANVTLGGMLSLMIYEGGGAKVAFFNDRCNENSYDSSATCWTNPKARYSYQLGLAPVHTSNFHPCADVGWTSKMRARLDRALADAGYAPTAAEVSSVGPALHTFCPNAAPTRVDYYILTIHSVFGVPTNTSGNDLPHAGTYPFFNPRVVIDLFFDALASGCASLSNDRSAIAVFGGGDSSYQSTAKQDQILALWNNYRAAHCP